jgi:AcrR family transcriptional regulator
MKFKSFEKIQIIEIIRTAQTSRATFYRNFDAKIDVLSYMCDKTFEGLIEEFENYHKIKHAKHSSDFIIPFLNYFDKHTLIVEQLIKAKRQDILSES